MTFRNRARCTLCGDIIESTNRHDFRACSCGAIYVDGGNVCPRGGAEPVEAFERVP